MTIATLTEHYAETGLGIQQLSHYLVEREGRNVCPFVEAGRLLLVSVQEMYATATEALAFIDEVSVQEELQSTLNRIDTLLEEFSSGLIDSSILCD